MATTNKNTEAARNAEPYSWQDMREIRIPRAAKGEPNYVFVGVNGKNMQVPRGKTVTVPYPIYERLQLMLDAQEKQYEFRDEIPNEG